MVLKEWWSPIGVASHQGGLPPGWTVIRVASHQGGLSSGWPPIRVVSHQYGLSSGVSLCLSVAVLGCIWKCEGTANEKGVSGSMWRNLWKSHIFYGAMTRIRHILCPSLNAEETRQQAKHRNKVTLDCNSALCLPFFPLPYLELLMLLFPAVCCYHCMIGAVVSVGVPHDLFSCVFRSTLLATSGSRGSSGMSRVTWSQVLGWSTYHCATTTTDTPAASSGNWK